MLRRYGLWRSVFWAGGSSVTCCCLAIAVIGFLLPPPQLLWPSPAHGRLYRGDRQIATVTLNWQGGRGGYWEGRLSSFPVGTAAHFRADTAHGFFVVHLTNGQLVALTDRSNHRGQRVYWYDPSPYWHVAGFMDHDYGSAYRADGARLGGPARRALDPYPLTIVGDRVRIAGHAVCPAPAQSWETWCR